MRILALPDVDFYKKLPTLHYLTVIFGVFEQFLAKPHLVGRQNRTFWTFGKNMSATAYPKVSGSMALKMTQGLCYVGTEPAKTVALANMP